jgi:hypothetical protein
MAKPEPTRPAPVPCESDAWPFSGDLALFEARRAVGQLVRTMTSLIPSRDPIVVTYIFATNVILDTLRDEVLPELVAEARSLNVPWAEIGEALGVGDTAAQKRFGKERDSSRADRAIWDAKVAQLTGDIAMRDMYGSDESLKADMLEDMSGTTLAERMRYSFKLISGAYRAFKEAEEDLNRPPEERDYDKFITLLTAAHNKTLLLAKTVLPDPEQWMAATALAEQPIGPDSAHYYAPATYIFYTLRQVMLASIYSMLALDEGIDFEKKMQFFGAANGRLEAAMLILSRADVQSALENELNDDDSDVKS